MVNSTVDMVTPTNELLALIAERDTKKWDLVDPHKRDPWLLATVAELKDEPEVWAASVSVSFA